MPILSPAAWFLALLALAMSVASAAGANSGGRYFTTGAPPEPRCDLCHAPATASNPGSLSVLAPEVYTPGETYEIQVSLIGAQDQLGAPPLRWGFGITALDSATGQGAGSFAPLGPGVQTQLATLPALYAGRSYGTHTFCVSGSCPQIGGSPGWSLDWTAPATDLGDVVFYATANAANGNGFSTGDAAFAATQLILSPSGPSPVPSLGWPALGLLIVAVAISAVLARSRFA